MYSNSINTMGIYFYTRKYTELHGGYTESNQSIPTLLNQINPYATESNAITIQSNAITIQSINLLGDAHMLTHSVTQPYILGIRRLITTTEPCPVDVPP